MTSAVAIKIQQEIETILTKNNIHYKVEMVNSPELKFINLNISIKEGINRGCYGNKKS